jgi:signal transduction histidine kinase
MLLRATNSLRGDKAADGTVSGARSVRVGAARRRSTIGGPVQTLLLLRWVLIIATSYLVLFSGGHDNAPVAVLLFVAGYFASNLLLAAILRRSRSRRALDVAVVLFDTGAICLGLALAGNVSRDFFLLYFMVLFLGALTERIGLVVTAAVIGSVVHLTTVAQFVGADRMLLDGYALRIPFLLVVALFFSHLAQEERRGREVLRGEFLSTVSHDLRSPLSVIESLADLLLEGDAGTLNAEQASLVRRIHASAHHVLTLAQNLLGAARIEAGTLFLQCTSDNLRVVVEKALNFARSASDLKEITLSFNPDPDLPLIPLDRLQMERVVNNLLDNAIKYTPEGGTIDVSIERQEDRVALVVRDDGPGIPPQQLPSLFQKYQRAARQGRVDGSGLGLFIVKAIVDAHGGNITVDSSPGKGTAVRVCLPSAPPDAEPAALQAPAARRWWRTPQVA